jgi:hypothetical protein
MSGKRTADERGSKSAAQQLHDGPAPSRDEHRRTDAQNCRADPFDAAQVSTVFVHGAPLIDGSGRLAD